MSLWLVIRIMVVLCLLKMSRGTSLAKPNCQEYCGNVEIIYPFGIGPNCYLDNSFEIECRDEVETPFDSYFFPENESPSKPYIKSINLQLLSINSFRAATIYVAMPITFKDLGGTPFFFSADDNVFTGFGCNIVAYLADETENQNAIVWCASVCGSDSYPHPCQASLQENLQTLHPRIQKITTNVTINSSAIFRNTDNSLCEVTLLVQQGWIDSFFSLYSTEDYCNGISSQFLRVTLGYMVDSDVLINKTSSGGIYGSNLTTDCQMGLPIIQNNNTIISNRSVQCSCRSGYSGNPYLPGGCIACKHTKARPR